MALEEMEPAQKAALETDYSNAEEVSSKSPRLKRAFPRAQPFQPFFPVISGVAGPLALANRSLKR
jgi:hypothetical protein